MEVRSSLEFRSNIYPVTAKRRVLDDAAFVTAISDPKALVELEKVSRRPPLSDLQKWQLKKGEPCSLGDGRHLPWGTKSINGRQEVVCLCDREDCVLFEKCMERHPSVVELAGPDVSSTEEDRSSDEKSSGSQFAGRRLRLGVEKRDATSIASGAIRESTWSDEDDARLKFYFARYPREILYGFFPEKDVTDIEQRIRRVCLPPVKKKAANNDDSHGRIAFTGGSVTSTPDTPSGTDGSIPSHSQRKTASVPRQTIKTTPIRQRDRKLEEKRKRQEELRKRPWDASEDAVVARNYPLHGSNMLLWDEKLFGRKKDAIEKRAEILGLRRQSKPANDTAAHKLTSVKEENRSKWEELQIEKYYSTYGNRWGQWKRLVPWLSSAQLVLRAKELGYDGAWSYSAKRQFLQNEGVAWSVDELDTLIHEYPLKPEWSTKWKELLPTRTMEERRELAALLCLPSKDEIADLASKAAQLV